jgi:hypothetical protein
MGTSGIKARIACQGCAALRERVKELEGLLRRWMHASDEGFTEDEGDDSGPNTTLLQETIEVQNDTRAALGGEK